MESGERPLSAFQNPYSLLYSKDPSLTPFAFPYLVFVLRVYLWLVSIVWGALVAGGRAENVFFQ
jgi:hypothetical protein